MNELDFRKKTITDRIEELEKSEGIYLQSVSTSSQALMQFQKRILILEEERIRHFEEKLHSEGEISSTLTLINLGVQKALIGISNIERVLLANGLMTKEDIETKDALFRAECEKRQKELEEVFEDKYLSERSKTEENL